MIYKLNRINGEITPTTADDASRALRAFGWTEQKISEMLHSAITLSTPTFFYCRFESRLKELTAAEVV